ncbi:1-aminocyclopropane-1-carboxylate deaminase/D-cysteine desulfhydrase [Alkalimarinus alittae]|uniref:Pyridoxal-phosphate dependent enzyme n=1 Tax=Alkalimarinus alittae TaxID=2961619 RepID=A0ABY6N643_9ALTE|nr:pyridoxal-phosphate dependent enzyme [Alkalimarinus alittae]UZE97447.1 pyridoxal-phosphate dependent enzyme [Alkalimarinus alittae]
MAEGSIAAAWLKEPKDIPVISLNCELLDDSGVELWVARLDLVDPLISGNKWFKLKYNLLQALDQGATHVVSFGGAYSNHLHALAAACHRLGLKSTAVIRGELVSPYNATLQDCELWGMSFLPVSRIEYREKTSPKFLQSLHDQLGEFYLVPEGGSNTLAVQGMSEVASAVLGRLQWCDYLCCAVGSGGTLSGLIAGADSAVSCLGYSALKGGQYLEDDIKVLINQYQLSHGYTSDELNNKEAPMFEMVHDYHFGGFAKVRPELLSFIAWFEGRFEIPLEQVYTAKMFYGIFDQIKMGYFNRGQRIVAVHTGGLQGRRGLKLL